MPCLVYEKIEDDEKESKEPVIEAINEEEEKEETKEEESEDEVKEEMKEDEEEDERKEDEKGGGDVRSLQPHKEPQQEKKPSKASFITSSSVMILDPETNVPKAVERTDPLPRINSSLVIAGHMLYLYGGLLEVGDREVTLDDMWALDLRKTENWECLWPGTMHRQVWRGAIFDDDDSYISTSKEDSSDDDGGSTSDEEKAEAFDELDSKPKPKHSSKKSIKAGLRQEIARLNEKYNLDDENRTPLNTESLADFYSRTSKYWNGQAANALDGTDADLSNKELKKAGFRLAQERYDKLKAVVDRMASVSMNSKQDEKQDSKKDKKSTTGNRR